MAQMFAHPERLTPGEAYASLVTLLEGKGFLDTLTALDGHRFEGEIGVPVTIRPPSEQPTTGSRCPRSPRRARGPRSWPSCFQTNTRPKCTRRSSFPSWAPVATSPAGCCCPLSRPRPSRSSAFRTGRSSCRRSAAASSSPPTGTSATPRRRPAERHHPCPSPLRDPRATPTRARRARSRTPASRRSTRRRIGASARACCQTMARRSC